MPEKAFSVCIKDSVFIDPACGSGNFLTETYICLRKLENKALKLQQQGQTTLFDPIRVSIAQFLGIEINDFAVSVAQTALWIAESQMMRETEELFNIDLDFLPLKTNAGILEGNALTMDWKTVFANDKIDYIMGNPPFIGHQNRSEEQIEDLKTAFYDLKNHGKLDYVCGWYNKAADFMKGTNIECAFVSTNSICQGESVGIIWKHLIEKKNVEIQFAHKSFAWSNEASDVAHVHVVIIGFTVFATNKQKIIYDNNQPKKVTHINGYLMDAQDIYIESRGKMKDNRYPEMHRGSQATDGGNLFLSENEKDEFIKEYPDLSCLIKQFMGSEEFINNKKRYCFWLKDINPQSYAKNPIIISRLEKVKEVRLNSPTASVRNDALTPMFFTQIRQPETDYLVVPKVSSESRRYIPIGYLSSDIIASDGLQIISNADLYMFGILISNVHMSWMRVVAGRLEMRYNYTPAVYNNFPWPNPTIEQKTKIEKTSQAILDARNKYLDSSLADMYGEHMYLYPELLKAHQENDKAVMEAYGFDWKNMTESQCVSELMKMYQKLSVQQRD